MTTAALLVFARCAGFLFRAPGFSHPAVPRLLRAGCALALAVAVAPSVRACALDGLALIAALVFEFALGTAIGVGASVLYDAAYAAGRMVDDYVGVKAIAPSVSLVAPSGFGRIWSLAFTAAYAVLGAYRPVLLGFSQSFERIPPGIAPGAHAWFTFGETILVTIVTTALSIAGPAIALAFIVQVALGALSRTIPRFASFSLSFPLVFAAAIAITAISLPILIERAGHPNVLLPVHP